MQTPFRHFRETILASGTVAATGVPLALVDRKLSGYKYLVATLDITAAERDSSDELYDVWIIMGDAKSTWDIVHFPQIATTGAKRYTARVSAERFAEVTTATPGVAAEPTSIMATVTGGSGEGSKTLAAGKVRHGPFADFIGVAVTIAGTVATGITFSVDITAGG